MFTLILISTLLAIVYWFIKQRYNYWNALGIEGPKAVFPFGTFDRKGNPTMNILSLYHKYKGTSAFIGLINVLSPAILVLDTKLVKRILVQDFHHFSSRGIYHNEKDDPLSGNLFNIDGQKWKRLRTKLTPTFTSGKMKYMFGMIVAVSEEFRKALSSKVSSSSSSSKQTTTTIEMKELLARFTTDVIGTCAFGIECRSMTDPDAKFRQMGLKAITQSRHSIALRILMTSMPGVARLFGMKIFPDDVSDFFMSVVAETVHYRIENKVQRNDFMDLMIKMYVDDKKIDDKGGLSFKELAAQAWIFFFAGFETSSSAMSYALYELAQNQEIQNKARQDVLDALEKHNNEFTYEAMQDMTYLECCVNESLRKYPPVPALLRRVVKDYKEPTTNVTLRKGQIAFIPVFSMHHDQEYYPDPEEYNPDRFCSEETQKRDPFAFLPFGEGPRNCIGLRFGMMQSKVGLAMLLTNFRFTLNEKTPVPLSFTKDNFLLTSDTSMYFDVERF